jgi:carbonic anhydrase
MKKLSALFEGNRAWAASMTKARPDFFSKLASQQSPKYLWIGCSDSRVPANEICGLEPGEMFVHRNIANVVGHTDFSCLAVLQYAVEVLKVSDVIVCGHYGCGGVLAALNSQPLGLIDNWLRHIKDVYHRHRDELLRLDKSAQGDRLCELNVAEQVANICYTTTVQDAWSRGQPLSIHGWTYSLSDGLLRDLDLCVSSMEQLPAIYHMS